MASKDILFRTDIARGGARVDRKTEVISGFAVVTKGITPEMIAEWDKASEGKVLPENAPTRADAKQRLIKFLKKHSKKK